jgi:hypothetical protein
MSSKSFQNASKLNGIVSVLQFGAVGDGVTDDTGAIQAAIDSGATEIRVPKGVYLVSPLTITGKTSMQICGTDVAFGSQFKLNQTGAIFNLVGSSNVLITKLGLLPDTSISGTEGIRIDENSNIRVIECIIYSFRGAGVRFTGTLASQISGCIVRDNLFLSNGKDGTSAQLDTYYANDFSYTGNQFGSFSPTTEFPAVGVRLDYSSNGFFSDNLIWACVNGGNFTNSRYNRIANNRFEESRQNGCQIVNCDEFIFTGNWLNDNSSATTNTYNHLTLQNVQRSVFSSNSFYPWDYPSTVAKYSIELKTNSTFNTFSSNKSVEPGTAHIVLDSSCSTNNFDASCSFSSVAQVTGGSTVYLSPSGQSNSVSSGFITQSKVAVTRLLVAVDVAPASSETVTATLFVNGAATAILATITGAAFSAQTFAPLEIPQEALVSVRLQYSASATSSLPRVLLQMATI